MEYLLIRPPIIMLLGAGCSSVSRTMSQAAWQWNIVQVSYASTASDLSNTRKYPLFYRVLQPDSSRIAALISFLKFYKWNRIALLGESDAQSNKVMAELDLVLIRENFTIITSQRVTGNSQKYLSSLKEKDARIIVTLLHTDMARRVLCQVSKVGLLGNKYVWLHLNGLHYKWWLYNKVHDDCTNEQWLKASSGQFFISSMGPLTGSGEGVSRKSSQEVINILSKDKGIVDDFSLFAFDAVWVVALTLHKAAQLVPHNKTLDGFNYKDQQIAETIKSSLQKLSFQGVTGHIEFDQNGDRIAPISIVQLQKDMAVTVASYDSMSGKLSQNNSTMWQGGSPPLDGQRVIHEVVHVTWSLYWCLIALTSCGVILTLIFFTFNTVYRKHSYIKLSSPNINNVMLVGALFIYSSVFIILVDSRVVQASTLPGLCTVTGFVLGIGFSLIVGAMFSKTWRVYQILNKVYTLRKVFKDRELCGVIVVFVAVDLFMFTLMSVLDPFVMSLRTVGQLEQSDPTILYQYEYCSSRHITTWYYVIFGYKALTLLVGCFIAIVTRKVKARALNDSRYVGASISVITVAAFVGTPLVFSLSERNAVVAALCFSLIIPTTITLCLIFIPKISKIRSNPEHLLHLKSLSAMHSDNEVNTEPRDMSNGGVCATIMHLQIDLAKVQKELREQKALNASGPNEDSNKVDDHVDASTLTSPRRILAARSNTCQNLTGSPKQQPANHHRRHNTISAPSGNHVIEPVEPNSQQRLQIENASLRRKLRQTKINEAGKMCKVLYENADLNRKIVELQSMSSTRATDEQTVSRLIKENNELKKQLGEVGILNSVYCDMTRMKRKEFEHNNNNSTKQDLRELQHLLTVNLGGGRASSFGPSRSKRPPTIGLSQSSLNLLEPKDDRQVAGEGQDNQADHVGKSVTNQEKISELPEKTEQNHDISDSGPEKGTTEDIIEGTGKFNQPQPISSSEEFALQKDNKGFQNDQKQLKEKNITSEARIPEKPQEIVHDNKPSMKDNNASLEYETSKTKELLEKGKVSVTQRFTLPKTKNESSDSNNEPNCESEYRPTFGQTFIRTNNEASSLCSPQHPNFMMEDENGDEHRLIERKRRKSKRDRQTKIEKVEKTFFV